MSVIYKARDTQTGQDVALKLLTLPASLTSEQAKNLAARFERGSRTLARFSHLNVVSVHEIGVAQGRPYLAMEYLRGQTLRDRLSGGKLPPAEACLILAQIAEALDAIHNTGIVYRDVKPTNVMLLANGVVKLLDFGIAPSSDETALTDAGIIVGSPSCMAPEQVKGEPETPATDIWALGVLSCEMLAGHLPFTGQTAGSVPDQITDQSPAPTPNLPAAVQNVLHRALDKHPSQRYPTAHAFVQALKSALPEPMAAAPQAVTPKFVSPQPVASQAVERVAAAPKLVSPKSVAPQAAVPKSQTSPSASVKPSALSRRSVPRWLPGAALPLLFLLGFCGAYLKWHRTPDAVQKESAGQMAQKTVLPDAFQASPAPVQSVPQLAAPLPRRPEAQTAPRRHQTARVNESGLTQPRKYPVVQASPVMQVSPVMQAKPAVQAKLESAPPRPSLLSLTPTRPRRSAVVLKQTAQHIPVQHISAQPAGRRVPVQKAAQAVVLVKAAAPQLLVRNAAPQVSVKSAAPQVPAQNSGHSEPIQSPAQGFTLPSESESYDPEAEARLRKSTWSQNGAASSP